MPFVLFLAYTFRSGKSLVNRNIDLGECRFRPYNAVMKRAMTAGQWFCRIYGCDISP